MMAKLYQVGCIGICVLFVYANYAGWNIIDLGSGKAAKPTGGARMYHK
jgi:hypothetical protein